MLDQHSLVLLEPLVAQQSSELVTLSSRLVHDSDRAHVRTVGKGEKIHESMATWPRERGVENAGTQAKAHPKRVHGHNRGAARQPIGDLCAVARQVTRAPSSTVVGKRKQRVCSSPHVVRWCETFASFGEALCGPCPAASREPLGSGLCRPQAARGPAVPLPAFLHSERSQRTAETAASAPSQHLETVLRMNAPRGAAARTTRWAPPRRMHRQAEKGRCGPRPTSARARHGGGRRPSPPKSPHGVTPGSSHSGSPPRRI